MQLQKPAYYYMVWTKIANDKMGDKGGSDTV